MKIQLYLLLLIALTACHSGSNEKLREANSTNDSKLHEKVSGQEAMALKIDTLKINDQAFIQTVKGGRFYCLLSLKGDTVVKAEDGYHELALLDINEDGYQDIRVFMYGTEPNVCDNYLFHHKQKMFKLIANCDLDIQKVKGTDFFYSYNAVGCADRIWESHLSKIENDQLVDYGYIYGQDCDEHEIAIYKVNPSDSEDMQLKKKLPYQQHIHALVDKWEFIKKYWKENYRIFE